jgi:hypothetical protein
MTDEEQVDPEEPVEVSVQIEAAQKAGVWANFARVSHSPYEFTLDFIRLDFSQEKPEGIVVSRVSVSPLFITQLIGALDTNWQKYAEKAMPKELMEGGGDDEQSGG